MDTIRIENLEVYGRHGVLPEEQALGQKFLVSAVLYLSTREAGRTDDLTKTINYAQVCQQIKALMENNCYKLIETVAEEIATLLLTSYDSLREVEIEIKKPWAPILLPIETVSIGIRRGWHTLYLSVGSNMGDKEKYIRQGIDALAKCPFYKAIEISDLIVTKPYGDVPQEDFLNGCVRCETLENPREVLERIHKIEQENQRVREIHWGPRTLDMDILYYDDLQMAEEDLIIPHPEIPLREFVLEPLKELAPYLVHPRYQLTTLEMLAALTKE